MSDTIGEAEDSRLTRTAACPRQNKMVCVLRFTRKNAPKNRPKIAREEP